MRPEDIPNSEHAQIPARRRGNVFYTMCTCLESSISRVSWYPHSFAEHVWVKAYGDPNGDLTAICKVGRQTHRMELRFGPALQGLKMALFRISGHWRLIPRITPPRIMTWLEANRPGGEPRVHWEPNGKTTMQPRWPKSP